MEFVSTLHFEIGVCIKGSHWSKWAPESWLHTKLLIGEHFLHGRDDEQKFWMQESVGHTSILSTVSVIFSLQGLYVASHGDWRLSHRIEVLHLWIKSRHTIRFYVLWWKPHPDFAMSAGIKQGQTQSVITHGLISRSIQLYKPGLRFCPCYNQLPSPALACNWIPLTNNSIQIQMWNEGPVIYIPDRSYEGQSSHEDPISHISLVIPGGSYLSWLHVSIWWGSVHCWWDHGVLKVSNNEWNFPPNFSNDGYHSQFNGWNDACLHGTHFLLLRLIMIWRYVWCGYDIRMVLVTWVNSCL